MSGSPTVRSFDEASIDVLVMIGWSGRDTAAVEAHIAELASLGMPRPTTTPVFYRVAPELLTTASTIHVLGDTTSGEVEFVLVSLDDELWVGLGSDHTDREAERTSVARSKQLCAKPAASSLWRFADVADRWDRLELRSWAHRGGHRTLYQEGSVASLLPPADLIARYESSIGAPLARGTALFGGTLSTIDGISPADEFEIELVDPQLDRRLRHHYRITTLPVAS